MEELLVLNEIVLTALALPSGGGSVDACWVSGVPVIFSSYMFWREDLDLGKRKQESPGLLMRLELWCEKPPASGASPLNFSELLGKGTHLTVWQHLWGHQ